MASDSWDLDPSRFTFEKTFLDPVHGDINVSAIEHEIIDTAAFQRLRGIKQLGTADLVFHGAKHDRLGHSLGTMHVADQMVTYINSRADLKSTGSRVSVRARRLIRLAALLHDIGHAPFGHQLEDDFAVLPKHDRPEMYGSVLASTAEIGSLLSSELREALLALLSAKEDDQINALEFPYAADIVGNTVCADLLDYTRRDVYFTGLDKRSGWRMLKYLFIPEAGPSAGRIVIDAWKNDRLRSDVISDILDLLDVRFALSERVIFHHTKMATGAMLARAVQDSSIGVDDIVQMRDDELLTKLASDPSESAARLAGALTRRTVYRAIWISTDTASAATREVLAAHFAGAPKTDRSAAFKRKMEFEDSLTRYLGLPSGSVLVSCSSGIPLFKQADSRIHIEGDIRKLHEVSTDPPSGAIEELRRRHRSLWRFYVFLAPELVDQWAEVVVDAVDLRIRPMVASLRNELPDIQPRGGAAIVDRFARTIEGEDVSPLSMDERTQLLQLAARGERPAENVFDLLATRLDDLRAPAQERLELE
jgi:uncharacterized protein